MPPQDAAITANRIVESVRPEAAIERRVRPASGAEETLLPRTLSGLFDEAFDLYKRHFTTIALCVACLYLPALALFNLMQSAWLRPLMVTMQDAQGDAADAAGLKVGLLYILQLSVLTFGLILASGPATIAVAACSQGQPITVKEAFRRALPAFPRLAAHGIAALLATLCATAAGLMLTFFALGVVALTFSRVNLPELSTLFAFLTVAIIIIVPYLCGSALLARYFLLTPPLTVLENLPLSALMERSGHLARRSRFRRVWLAAIFLPLVTLGLELLVEYAAESVITALRLNPFMGFAAQTGASALFSFLLQPYWIIFLCLLYFDCRVRRDGLDVSRLADAAGLPHPDGPLPNSPTLAVPLTIYSVSSAQNPATPQMPYQTNTPYPPMSGQPPPYVPPPYIPPGGSR